MGNLDDRWSELIAVTSDDPWSQAAGRCTGCHLAGIGCRFGIVEETRVGEEIHARIRFDPTHSGGPGVAHGGVVTGAFDEMSGHVPWSVGRFAVTRSITVDFRRPVPVDTPLLAVARPTLIADGVWHIEATLHVEGRDDLLAASRGDWVERDMGHFTRFRAWQAGG
jgi:acyl-coenzyme A thioesterase PaaI-like protein